MPHDYELTLYAELVYVDSVWYLDGVIYHGVPKGSELYRKVLRIQREEKIRRICEGKSN